jgi:hypothetical protein
VDTRFGGGQQATLELACGTPCLLSEPEKSLFPTGKDRIGHPVAGRDAELLGGTADHLEHGKDGSTRRHQAFRQRLGVLGNAQDTAPRMKIMSSGM